MTVNKTDSATVVLHGCMKVNPPSKMENSNLKIKIAGGNYKEYSSCRRSPVTSILSAIFILKTRETVFFSDFSFCCWWMDGRH